MCLGLKISFAVVLKMIRDVGNGVKCRTKMIHCVKNNEQNIRGMDSLSKVVMMLHVLPTKGTKEGQRDKEAASYSLNIGRKKSSSLFNLKIN